MPPNTHRPRSAPRSVPLVIRLLRTYGMYAPWERGKARAAALMRSMLASQPAGERLELSATDGRRFQVDCTEPQFWMGLIDRGVFEPHLTAMLRSLTRPGSTVIDAGANFGWFTTLFSALVGDDGSVHAFEPMPHTAALLRDNCALNACANVRIVEMALGASPGTSTLFLQEGRACGDASMFGAAQAGGTTHVCRVTTLDDYVESERLTRCDLIKCDVEGAELLFLQGATKTLERYQPTIAIEINPEALARARCKPSDVLREIAGRANYVFEAIDENSSVPRRIGVESCDGTSGYVNVVCRAASGGAR